MSWSDGFYDRVVLSIDGLPYFHNPDCDLDPCQMRVQLRWLVDGHLEIHYDMVDPTHFVAMALGLRAHAESRLDLPMPCSGWFPVEQSAGRQAPALGPTPLTRCGAAVVLCPRPNEEG